MRSGAPGNYRITISATNGIGAAASQSLTITIVPPPPTAAWTPVTSPTKTAVDSATIVFSEPIQGMSLADFTLNGISLSGIQGVSIAAGSAANSYVIKGLSSQDAANKTYTLAVQPKNTITNLFGGALATTPSVSWVVNGPTPSLASITRESPTSARTNQTSVSFLAKFSEKVTGVNTNSVADFGLVGTAIAGGKIGTPSSSDGGLTWVIPVAGSQQFSKRHCIRFESHPSHWNQGQCGQCAHK